VPHDSASRRYVASHGLRRPIGVHGQALPEGTAGGVFFRPVTPIKLLPLTTRPLLCFPAHRQIRKGSFLLLGTEGGPTGPRAWARGGQRLGWGPGDTRPVGRRRGAAAFTSSVETRRAAWASPSRCRWDGAPRQAEGGCSGVGRAKARRPRKATGRRRAMAGGWAIGGPGREYEFSTGQGGHLHSNPGPRGFAARGPKRLGPPSRRTTLRAAPRQADCARSRARNQPPGGGGGAGILTGTAATDFKKAPFHPQAGRAGWCLGRALAALGRRVGAVAFEGPALSPARPSRGDPGGETDHPVLGRDGGPEARGQVSRAGSCCAPWSWLGGGKRRGRGTAR